MFANNSISKVYDFRRAGAKEMAKHRIICKRQRKKAQSNWEEKMSRGINSVLKDEQKKQAQRGGYAQLA